MAFDPVAFIGAHAWTFAKTQPKNPHWYVVRRKVDDDASFDAMVSHIRANGVERVWGRKVYIVWYDPDGEHHYWTMGWPVQETTIINRADEDQTKPYFPALRLPYSSPDGQKPEGVK